MATTINSYNVKLTLDASDYISKSDLSRKETAQLTRAINAARNPMETYARTYDLLEKALSKNSISLATYKRLLDEAKQKTGLLATAAQKLAAEERAIAAAEHAAATEAARLNRVMADGQRVTQSYMTAEERLRQELTQVNALYRQNAISAETYRRAVSRIQSQNIANVSTALRSANAATTKHVTGLGRLAAGYQNAASKLTPLVSLMGAYVGFATARRSVSLAIEVEQAAAQFEVMTNSAHNAKVLMRDLRDFAAQSPVTFTGATDSAKTMLMFNVQVQDVMRNVKMLGDITGGNAQRFQSLTLAFSQMTSAGRLMGQDLLQMVNAGFNPLQQISLKTGESMVQLKKRMEDGGISAAEVTQAFVDATSEGGKFDGMSEKLAQTIGGKLTLAMSDLEQVGIKLGESLGPLIITMTEGFSKGVGPLSQMLGIVGKIADGWGLIAATVTDVSTLIYDIGAKMAGGEGSGRTDALSNVNGFLDLMDKRDADRAAAKQDLGGLKDIKPAADAVDALGDSAEALKKKAKDAASAIKEQERAAEALKKADLSRMQSALANAQAHFAAERQMQLTRSQQLASTKITSMDVGSAEAAKFLADQRNARLANSSRPEPIKETQQQLLIESQKQYAILVAQEKKQAAQIAVLEKILDNAKQNGFRRIK